MASKIRFSIESIPVDALLHTISNAFFSEMEDALKLSAKLADWLLPRHIMNFHLHLPRHYHSESFVFKSGLKVQEISKREGYRVRIEYGPELADLIFPLLPTGHPDNPLSYRILATCSTNSFIEKNDLKIMEYTDAR